VGGLYPEQAEANSLRSEETSWEREASSGGEMTMDARDASRVWKRVCKVGRAERL
jgi:hypothetical protein